jgi:hypothetical protein
MRLLLILLLLIGPGLWGQTDAWVPLFNGRDLTGWKQLNGQAKFEVVNGEIWGTTVPNTPNSFLATEKIYGDFTLELEFLADSTMNSGIQFRSESRPDYLGGRVHGYQIEIDPSDRAWSGGIYDEARRLWLYTLEMNPGAKNAYNRAGWNRYRVECDGGTVRTFVNGVPAAHLEDTLSTRGFIALQVHSIGRPEDAGKQIRWRNIRIREGRPSSPTKPPGIFVVNLQPNALSPEEKAQGVRLLWDGRTSAGWRGAYKQAFPEKGWQIGEGILAVLPSAGAESANGGDIVTEEQFSAFELQFHFRLTRGANSGVKYFVTETEGNQGSAIGLEYQVLDDSTHPDALQGTAGNRTLASLYDLIPSFKFGQAYRKIGEWNRGMIRVHPDGRIEHFLNGYKVVEYQRGTQMFSALVARSKYAQWKDFGMAKKGRILLQDHGDRVEFRSVKIKEL